MSKKCIHKTIFTFTLVQFLEGPNLFTYDGQICEEQIKPQSLTSNVAWPAASSLHKKHRDTHMPAPGRTQTSSFTPSIRREEDAHILQ